MDRLIVKNFGPLKDIDIELNKINLFIGENGSGKSVLAKLITILMNLKKLSDKKFIDQLKYYNIDFLNAETEIKFLSDNTIFFEYLNGKIIYNEKINNLKDATKQIEETIETIFPQIKLSIEEFISIIPLLKKNKSMEQDKLKYLEKYLQTIEKLKSLYLPAERNLISLFNKSISSMIISDIPIAKFILEFASEYEKARDEIKELSFLNIRYENSDRDKIYYDKENYLPLEHSSSGIQSAIPMLLTVKYFAKKYGDIVIEEPEQNLFPKAQDEVIKFIIEQVNSENSNLFLMTHSPYVLSTLNNLIFAHKVSNLNNKAKEQVEELIKEEQWINPNSFSAYYLKDGIANSIVSKRGLISDNIIDDVSDEVDREFEELMEIYREYKQ